MDAALAIAVGSSTQIAMFVAPVLVFLSYFVGPQPMDLLSSVFEIAAIGVLPEHRLHRSRRRNALDERAALAVYAILVLSFTTCPHG
jgi:Ca2+:H+ antiporter